jgi:hypothetical protein
VKQGDGEFRSDMTSMVGRCDLPAHGCNDADELDELVNVVGSTAHRKRIMAQMIDVVLYPVVRIEECLHMPPRALDRVRMSQRRRM